MVSSSGRIPLAVSIALLTSVVSVRIGLGQEEPQAVEFDVQAQEEEVVDSTDFEETTPVVETILETDVDIGRVRVESDGGDNRTAVSWVRRRLDRNAGDFIEGCVAAERERRALERRDEEIDGSGLGAEPAVREIRGDLLLEGVCEFGLCNVRPRRIGSLQRGFANCIADATASYLSGFPDPEREYTLRIPLRFRVTETQPAVVTPAGTADDAPTE